MKFLSTPSVIFKVDQVDEENSILSKVIIALAGNIKSHFGSIDQTTLSQFQQIGNAKEHGIKARFGHPNMCSSSYGIYIGRFKNFQMISNCLYADLHLDPICIDCPSGNLYNYIISMAMNNSEMISTSIAFVPSSSETSWEDEYLVSRIQDVMAIILVDDPEVTSSPFAADTFSYPATSFLNANPAISNMISRKPEIVVEFLLKYFSNTPLIEKEIFRRLGYLFNSSGKDNREAA